MRLQNFFEAIPKQQKSQLARVINYARSSYFLAQNLSLPFLEFIATGKTRDTGDDLKTYLPVVLNRLNELLKKDADNIAQGVYPASVLFQDSLWPYLQNLPAFLVDGFEVARKRKARVQKVFSQEAQSHLEELPEYYTRNFHYQTDGYLSKKSAQIYDLQVEILFAGAAGAMRRLVLPDLMKYSQKFKKKKLKILEIACGTGSLTRALASSLPDAQIVAVDLSAPYLEQAKKQLKDFSKVSFIQGDGTALLFKDETFDVVVSCFLFHELPLNQRQKVLAESLRVLKKGGFLGMVDSLQSQDDPEMNWALERFPIDFHEPFYKNYIQNAMEPLWQQKSLQNFSKSIGFFSKALSAVKK